MRLPNPPLRGNEPPSGRVAVRASVQDERTPPPATFALVHLLRASEEAFPLAADAVLPFIRADIRHIHRTIASLSTAPEVVFTSAPAKMLDVVSAVAGDTELGTVYGLGQVLDRIRSADSSLMPTAKFQRLLRYSGGSR